MKLKTKIAVSFLMIIIIPVVGFLSFLLLASEVPLSISERFTALFGIFRDFPEWRAILFDLSISLLLILLFTAIMLSIWIYSSIVSPLEKLRKAAWNIKEGNLDFELHADARDEIGELSRDFEEMRIRLKESAEEKLQNEAENRELIRNISHDLKTPITAIQGYAEGILDGVADTPEKKDKYVRTIASKATEMTTLINELTLYSQIDTNRIPYNFARINVYDYFSDCAEEIGMDMENKGIAFHFQNNVEGDTDIIADPEQLSRVIHNIVNNSVKYMDKPEGFISLMVRDAYDFVQVEIRDNGKGVDVKELPYIFDRFYRTDESRNSSTGGSGIGLSIARKIIENHGGKIWATSKIGDGMTVYFVLRKYSIENTEKEYGKNTDR